MGTKTGRFTLCLAAAALAAGMLSCGSDENGSDVSDSGMGISTPILWNDSSGGGGGGSAGDTPLPWVDPSTGTDTLPPPDPTDIRTYTSPDIYILGNRHPLMTHVTTRTHPSVVFREDRVTWMLNEFRYTEYLRLIGSPLPLNARLTEFMPLRANARAHAKHYAVWVPDTPLPLVNEEGDSVWYRNPRISPGIEHLPDLQTVWSPDAFGRLPKCRIVADRAGQLVASGPEFFDPDAVARHWIESYPDFLRFPQWTQIGVGYWSNIGNGINHYWNAVFTRNARYDAGGDTTLPFPLF